MTTEMKFIELQSILEPHQLEFMPKRVVQYGESVYVQILAYKNARTDMEVLDRVVGAENWQNEYKRDSSGILQCGIGIWSENRNEWIWKWSNGKVSQIEKEKGEYSDAFKRAGYMWGIGRCLYDFPKVMIQLNDKEWREKPTGGVEATGFLKPDSWNWDIWIDYETQSYEQIVVTDKRGTIKFNLEPHKAKFKDPANRQTKTEFVSEPE